MKKFALLLTAFTLLICALPAMIGQASADILPTGTVIVDTDEILVCVTGSGYEEKNDEYVLEIYVENRTDEPIEVGAEKIAVNGIIVDGYMYDVMAAGRKSISYVEIYASTLRQLRLDCDRVSFTFYANKTFEGTTIENIIRTDVVLFPGEKTDEEIVSIDFEDFPMTQLDYENEFIRLMELDAKPLDGDFGYQIDFLVENRCDFDFNLDFANFKVNSMDIPAYCYCLVPAGMKAVAHVWIAADEMGDISVYDVDEVSSTLMLYEHSEESLTGIVEYPFFAYPVSFRPAKG